MQLTKPKEYSDDKPGKHEKVFYFKVCSTGCPNCDTKRIGQCGCKKQ